MVYQTVVLVSPLGRQMACGLIKKINVRWLKIHKIISRTYLLIRSIAGNIMYIIPIDDHFFKFEVFYLKIKILAIWNFLFHLVILRTPALDFTSGNRCASNKLCYPIPKYHWQCWCHNSNQDWSQASHIPITITRCEDIFLIYSRIFAVVCEVTFLANVPCFNFDIVGTVYHLVIYM